MRILILSLLVFLASAWSLDSCYAQSMYLVSESELQTLIDNNNYLLKNYKHYKVLLEESDRSLSTSKIALEKAEQESKMLEKKLVRSEADLMKILDDYNNLQKSWSRYEKDQKRKIRILKLERNIYLSIVGVGLVSLIGKQFK